MDNVNWRLKIPFLRFFVSLYISECYLSFPSTSNQSIYTTGKAFVRRNLKKNKRWLWRFSISCHTLLEKGLLILRYINSVESHYFENDIGLRILQNAYQNHPGTNVFHYLIKVQIKTNEIKIIKHRNNTILKNFEQNIFIHYSCYDKRSM